MKTLLFVVAGCTVGAFLHLKVALVNHDNQLLEEIELNRAVIKQQRLRIADLEKRFTAHEKDAKKAMAIVCDDVGKLRFSVKAIANSLKFVEVK